MDYQSDLGNGHVSVSQALLDWTDAQRKLGITEPQIVSQLLRVAELIGRPERTAVDGVLYDVTLDSGKYRFVYYEGGKSEAFRYGEPWQPVTDLMQGSNAFRALVARVAYLDEMLDMSARVVGTMIAVDTATPPVGSASLTAPVKVQGGGITITAQVELPFERVINCIVGGLEGGYSDWLHSFTPEDRDVGKDAAEKGTIWYARESFWNQGGWATAIYDLATRPEGNGAGKMVVNLESLYRGMNLMATKAPKHFADLVNENDDAITHDVFMQMVILGEIVYG